MSLLAARLTPTVWTRGTCRCSGIDYTIKTVVCAILRAIGNKFRRKIERAELPIFKTPWSLLFLYCFVLLFFLSLSLSIPSPSSLSLFLLGCHNWGVSGFSSRTSSNLRTIIQKEELVQQKYYLSASASAWIIHSNMK